MSPWQAVRGAIAAGAILAAVSTVVAKVDARMLRYPDVSGSHVAFVYAGDLWTVPAGGGSAVRLATPPGEESFPRFSPDGRWIAFSGNYDGNVDVYVIPVDGGVPRRLTWHPSADRVLDWYPDGRSILIASPRQAGKDRFNQLFRVPVDGGLPERLPLPYGEFGTIAGDGKTLAYMPVSRDFRTWKRYRGGSTTDIWQFDLESKTSLNLTESHANDSQPMWYGDRLYFLSDRGPHLRANIWAREADGSLRQVTDFSEFDVHFPAVGPDALVFEAGGRLYRLDLPGETMREVEVDAVVDLATLRPRTIPVANWISGAAPSPSGKRAVVEARGELFSVPAEHGPVINLTASSGVAERNPAWSPDGKEVAYFSDRSGEYDLVVRPAEGGKETVLAALGAGYRYQPFWSPDGKKIAWIDQAMTIRMLDRDSGEVRKVDEGLYMTHGALEGFRMSWSPDSRWLAYPRDLQQVTSAVFLFDSKDGTAHQVTSGFYSDTDPVFSPDGKYLFFLTNRTFDLAFSAYDTTWVYANATTVAAVPLRDDVPSPLVPRNDVEEAEGEGDDKADAKKNGDDEGKKGKKEKKGKKGDEEDAEDGNGGEGGPAPVEIDLDGFERRVVPLPAPAGNYADLRAVEGKILYRRGPSAGTEGPSPILMWSLEDREEKTVVGDADGYAPTADGKKLLVASNGKLGFVDVAPEQKLEKTLPVDRMDMILEPREEWRQIFRDAWRLERDYFYDPNMHGVDWDGMRARYGALLDDVVTRWDLNYLIGELIGELNSSHAYRGGGDAEDGPSQDVGLLGVDWEVADGAYRIARIVRGADWDTEVRSALDRPGVDVAEGDWVLAVNGVPLSIEREPWAALQGLAGQTVQLTVNSKPTSEGARHVLVETLGRGEDARLRNLAWIEGMRRAVDEATDGRVGYVYVPSTSVDGHRELYRMFLPQIRKDALIIDERFNNGGFIPDRMVELLNRPVTNYWALRDGEDWQWPPFAHPGPKVMLVNEWSGSGGDAFPHYFRKAGLGPLIGTTTWGGLIGISGVPGLIDGGGVTVPTFSFYDADGNWAIENEGVRPDIEVEDDPARMWDGGDPQLERAIEEALKRIETDGYRAPKRPAYVDRSGT